MKLFTGSEDTILSSDHDAMEGDVSALATEIPSEWTPEKEMYAALLLDALSSYKSALDGKERVRMNGAPEDPSRLVEEIERWLETDDEYPTAFGYTCYILGLSEGCVRRAFKKVKEEANERVCPGGRVPKLSLRWGGAYRKRHPKRTRVRMPRLRGSVSEGIRPLRRRRASRRRTPRP